MILSFGYKNSPPSSAKVGQVFDVRDLTHDVNSPAFLDQYQRIVEYGRAHPGETIAIGCEKGHHRSVVLANKVATALRTSVYHLDRR